VLGASRCGVSDGDPSGVVRIGRHPV